MSKLEVKVARIAAIEQKIGTLCVSGRTLHYGFTSDGIEIRGDYFHVYDELERRDPILSALRVSHVTR